MGYKKVLSIKAEQFYIIDPPKGGRRITIISIFTPLKLEIE